jgi:hypothetical protein
MAALSLTASLKRLPVPISRSLFEEDKRFISCFGYFDSMILKWHRTALLKYL